MTETEPVREMILIDAAMAEDLLRQAVALKGAAYIYTPEGATQNVRERPGQSCLNWHKYADAPGCIVGTALFLAGVTGQDFIHYGGCGWGSQSIINALPFVQATPKAHYLLSEVQSLQDQGSTWGDAVRIGLERTGRATDPETNRSYADTF